MFCAFEGCTDRKKIVDYTEIKAGSGKHDLLLGIQKNEAGSNPMESASFFCRISFVTAAHSYFATAIFIGGYVLCNVGSVRIGKWM